LVSQINIGDEMITANGLTIQEYYEKNKWWLGGANISGGKQSAHESLSFRGGSLFQMPKEDSITFRMKSFNTKREYTVTLPWIARRTDSCYAKTMQVMNSSSRFAPATPAKFKHNQYDGVHPLTNELKESFGVGSDVAKLEYIDTADTEVKYAIWKPESKNLGIIRLVSFVPSTSDQNAVDIIRSLLLKELKDTKAVVFDLRDNGGGSIVFAETLPQLFGANIEANNYRAIVSKVNEKIFLEGFPESDPFYQAYKLVKPGDKFTQLRKFVESGEANGIGMAYIKPVGVLHNGNCYSSCDIFSSILKDSVDAKIFGEDPSSGAGGANVVSVNGFLAPANTRDFTTMPFYEQLDRIAQDARVAWRQTVRVKKNAGLLIEDFGVESDKIIRPSRLDLIPTAEGNSQFDRVADELSNGGLFGGKTRLQLQVNPSKQLFAGQGVVTFDIETQGIKKIEVLKGQELLAELQIGLLQLGQLQNRQIRFDPKITEVTQYKYTIKGYDVWNNLVFSTVRIINGLPPLSSYLNLKTGSQQLQLDESSGYAYQVEKGVTGRKWTKNAEGGIQIVDYVDNVNNQMSYYLVSPSKSVSIQVEADYVTEFEYDFLIFGYRVGNDVVELKRFSGSGNVAETFTITPTAEFEFYIQFFSDGGFIEPNNIIKINKVTVTA
jgi:hypothetical protein